MRITISAVTGTGCAATADGWRTPLQREIVDRAGANNDQQSLIFTIRIFSILRRESVTWVATPGVTDTVARVRRALPGSQYAQYGVVSSVHYKSQKFVASTAGLPEVMRITINQSQLISSARCVTLAGWLA